MRLPSLRDVTSASSQVATKSAMNPILWKAAISFPVSIVCSLYAPEPLNYIIVAIGSLPIVVGSLVFPYFAKTDPNRLQSEVHLENMEMMARFGTKEPGKVITIESRDTVTNTPHLEDNT